MASLCQIQQGQTMNNKIFGDKPGLGDLMKKAQEMQKKMQEIQKQIADMEVTGQSGGGLVKIVYDWTAFCKTRHH